MANEFIVKNGLITPIIESTITTGAAPLVVSSTTKVINLNADLLDGYNTSVSSSPNTVVVRDGTSTIFGKFNGEAAISGGTIDSVIITNSNVGGIVISYDNRATIRSMESNSPITIQELGVFTWYSGTADLDDDETCFLTTNGRWLLESVNYDYLDYVTSEVVDLSSKFLTGTAQCILTSLATNGTHIFTGTVQGAEVGDFVIARYPLNLGDRLRDYAYVSSSDTVSIRLANYSGATQTINETNGQGTWNILVIKR